MAVESTFEQCITNLENSTFEEWLIFVESLLASDFKMGVRLLKYISTDHSDTGWRYNAIQKLLYTNQLSTEEIRKIIDTEGNDEIKIMIIEYIGGVFHE